MKPTFAALVAMMGFGPMSAIDFDTQRKVRMQRENNLGHKPTPSHSKSNTSCTKASHEESKTRRKMAAKSRRINRGK